MTEEEYKQLTIAWINMRQRCYNKKHPKYPDWGGRGIQVCSEWRNNKHRFITWSLLHGFKLGLTIDRINNDGNYTPKNCRWVTSEVQNRNTRKNVFLTHGGETLTASQWAGRFDMDRSDVAKAIKKGLSFEQIFKKTNKK